MTVYYTIFERGDYIYVIDISFSEYKLSLFPMVYMELNPGKRFLFKFGFITFMAEFQKIRKIPKENIKEFFNTLISDI